MLILLAMLPGCSDAGSKCAKDSDCGGGFICETSPSIMKYKCHDPQELESCISKCPSSQYLPLDQVAEMYVKGQISAEASKGGCIKECQRAAVGLKTTPEDCKEYGAKAMKAMNEGDFESVQKWDGKRNACRKEVYGIESDGRDIAWRAELPSNLLGIKKALIEYRNQHGRFVSCDLYPKGRPGARYGNWLLGDSGGFNTIGWAPDGYPRGAYQVELTNGGEDFVAIGISDVDNDSEYAVYVVTKSTNIQLVTHPEIY